MTLAEKFRAKVNSNGPVPADRPDLGPCHLWTDTTAGRGYGKMSVGGRYFQATHVALELAGRPLAPGEMACHHCDNPPCVNDAHLFAGTQADNVADAVAKGRTARGERNARYTHPETTVRGERVNTAKLTVEKVMSIRARYAAGGETQAALAAAFGVNEPAVFKIVSRRTWRHVSG